MNIATLEGLGGTSNWSQHDVLSDLVQQDV